MWQPSAHALHYNNTIATVRGRGAHTVWRYTLPAYRMDVSIAPAACGLALARTLLWTAARAFARNILHRWWRG